MSKGDYLYLANFTLVERRYMGDTTRTHSRKRLVWANTEDEAREKLLKAETRDDPYGFSVDVEGLELHEAIA